ncbi:MAG: VWA domain-containing protein [Archangium sp.]|nr:VWA domain-containing protein [Archangium sp.]MDP3574475.1 VWA domain-containing protein [Archangium sp.]
MKALPASFIAALVAVGCTDALVEKRQVQDINVDNRIAIAGRVCTTPPDPSGFPVKVVLVVDQSGSMCVSDPPGSQGNMGFCQVNGFNQGNMQPARVRAMQRLLQQFRSQPNVQVALVPFETNVKGVWPQPSGMNPQRFGRPNAELDDRLNALQSELGKGTDYQGALAYAYSLIASDIVETEATTPEVLPRTRYIVVFLTDGVPFPRCSGNDNLTQYADDLNPELTWQDSFGAGPPNMNFCNIVDPDDADAITGYVRGTDRNQNYQLFSYVKQIAELKDQYNVGDVRLHTVLMFNEEAVRACGPICQDIYGRYVRWPGPVMVPDGAISAKAIAKWTLQQLAQRGNGTYQEFSNFAGLAQLNLGALDYASLASRNVMKNLLVQPLSSEPGLEKREVDTDGDGLIDAFDNDFSHNTNKNFPDSDDDGFDDNFEVRRFDDGFRPDAKDGRGCDPASPLTPNCRSRDTDGDGLSQFAEAYLKTRPTLVDSDADGVPDGMEVRYGLDPKLRLANGIDTDGDGTSDNEEFRLGSNPIARDVPFQQKNAMQFALESEVQGDDSVCYDFKVSNLEMVTPPNRAGLTQGYNLFKVWFAEAPESGVATDYGVWKAACFWTQYDPPSVRIPAGPEGPPLSNSDFVAPQNIATPAQYDTTCLGISPARGTR